MRALFLLLPGLFLGACAAVQPSRSVEVLTDGWFFTRADSAVFAAADYDASAWQRVRVPHDWAIAGPFDLSIDRQSVRVLEDGDTTQLLRAGRTGALPFIGTGWYRYDLGELPLDNGRRYRLEFDGAMSHAEVYVNGRKVGERPYGYSSFAFDITDFLNDGDRNPVSVRLENLPESSRWYPGAGLYRHVRLVGLSPVHVAHWGTYVTTPEVGDREATVVVRTEVENHTRAEGITLRTTILDPDGREVARASEPLTPRSALFDAPRVPGRIRPAVGHRFAAALYGCQYADRARPCRGRVCDAVRHPHLCLHPRRGLFAQRAAAEAAGGLPPPRPGTAGCGREPAGHRTAARDDEGDGLQRHPHGAQSGGSRAARTVRPDGAAGHGGEFRRVADREEPQRLRLAV